MAFEQLKSVITQQIKTNGQESITGAVMQAILLEMVDDLGAWAGGGGQTTYATQAWVTEQLTGYATQSWVGANYIAKVSANSGSILINDGGTAWVTANLNDLITGYGYITSSGSCHFADSANILGHTVYENPAHALANGDTLVYDSGTGWVNIPLSSSALSSDKTMKTKVSDVKLSIEQIAKAPSIKFKWKDENRDKETHIGTYAQYWQTVLPELVSTGLGGKLMLDYAALATVSSIAIAKEVQDLKERVEMLEKKL